MIRSLAALVLLAGFSYAAPALADSTGKEVTDAAGCDTAEGADDKMKAACKKCLGKPGHHYHPDKKGAKACEKEKADKKAE